jgi:hypothetical protein
MIKLASFKCSFCQAKIQPKEVIAFSVDSMTEPAIQWSLGKAQDIYFTTPAEKNCDQKLNCQPHEATAPKPGHVPRVAGPWVDS